MKAVPRSKFFKYCKRGKKGTWMYRKGEVYDPIDRNEVIGLNLGIESNKDIWTSASPSLSKSEKYYKFKKGSGDPVISPETGETIPNRNRKCMTYMIGDSVGKYRPIKCSRNKPGICKSTMTTVCI